MNVDRNLNKQAGLAVHKDKDHEPRFEVQPLCSCFGPHFYVRMHVLSIYTSIGMSEGLVLTKLNSCIHAVLHILIRKLVLYYLTMEMSDKSVDKLEFRLLQPCRRMFIQIKNYRHMRV